jgi:hypothetical protein
MLYLWLTPTEARHYKMFCTLFQYFIVFRFVHWDVNNEMLHGSFFADRLGKSIREWMFRRAAELDPDADLLINDFDVVENNQLTEVLLSAIIIIMIIKYYHYHHRHTHTISIMIIIKCCKCSLTKSIITNYFSRIQHFHLDLYTQG